jgi:hypothetical protein
MFRSSGALVGTLICVCLPAAAREPALQPPIAPLVTDVRIVGAHDVAADAVREALRVRIGEPLPIPVDRLDDLAARVVRFYRDEGYTFATATASFDPASGELHVTVDEGVIDGVEFTGVDERLKRQFAEEFALRAGDVFNRTRARQALEVLLRPTRGAVRPGRIFERGGTFSDSRQIEARDSPQEGRGSFDLVDRNGRRVLLVGLSEPAGRFRLVPDLGDREDWFTPVDGFVPSLGFGAAVFDHERFNHAYVAGHLSYKTAADRAGYTLGFERPFFTARKLYVGGEVRDLTASDDQWQASSLEASLAAIWPRRSIRDYYRERGVQLAAAFRPHSRVELLAAWRTERQENLPVESDFSFWHSDEAFRPNLAARDGRLNALVVGASLDGEGFERESLDATYRRHQIASFFGERLTSGRPRGDPAASWRIDWTSELSAPEAFNSDFDFRRHVVAARYRTPLSPHQDFGARAVAGWSGGTLPPQRLFGIGGYGSVHGYDFKASTGTALALLNLEYALGWRDGFKLVGFYDTGRTSPSEEWLKGVGFGVGLGDFRIDFGYRLRAVPSSLHVVLRFDRTF